MDLPHIAGLPLSTRTSMRRGTLRPAPLWLLGLVALCGILTAHVFIPALPSAAADLHTSARTIQLTVSTYIAGLAVGQLFYGPLADRFGQRHILLGGLTIFTLASIAAGFASSAGILIACRLIQSLGGGVGLVLARAIARRGVDAREATRRLALMNLVITLGPVLSPLIGATITALLGWRYIFAALVLIGLVNIFGSWARIPEVEHVAPDTRTVLRAYVRLLITPTFIAYAIAGGCFTTSMYAIIGAAPFILIHRFGFVTAQVGPVLASGTIGIWIGSIATSRLVHRVPTRSLLLAGSLCTSVASVSYLGLVLSGTLTVPGLIATLALFMLGVGLSGPPALALAMGVDPRAVASGSGLYGSAQMAVGALCSFGAAQGPDPALGAGYTICIASGIGMICIAIARQTHREG